jgi:uncharacterized membrane protein
MLLRVNSLTKLASILTAVVILEGINIFSPLTPIANAATGPVNLCNGDAKEETINAAILYYSFEKRGWVQQGWYVIQPGKCALVNYYEGGMFVYGQSASGNSVYADSRGTGFCIPKNNSGFYGRQRVNCKRSEKFVTGIPIDVPSGSGLRFTFGNPDFVNDF